MTDRAALTRREMLFGAACLCGGPALLGSANSATSAFAMEEVAPGIYIRRGRDEEATPANSDAIANIGFIVGREAVAVMDPGGSLEDGVGLRAKIRAITKLPIRYVILSHVHPDHIFGAGAFEHDNPVFVGHARLPAALAQRGEYYRGRLDQVLGRNNAGPLIAPTTLVDDRAEVNLGGRVLALTAHATAHSDCDLSAFDAQTATLLPADLLFVKRIPSLDGSLAGWVKDLAALTALPAKQAVPGHGPTHVPWPAGAADLERYLNVLLRETRAAIAKGIEITEAVETVAQSERGKWTLFDEYHGHNVIKAFKELEWG